MKWFHFTLMLGVCLTCTTHASENNAPVYPIVEPDMLQDIERVLRAKEASGEIDRLQKEARDRAQARLQNPEPVAGIAKATKNRVLYFDPTVVAQQTIYGPRGEVVVPAGTRVNPLDYQSFGAPMLFLDGRDPRQIKHAKGLLEARKGDLMPVLTGGSFIDLTRQWKTRVFYDQSGRLTQRLGIKFVPALVSQEGNRLKIEELKL